MTSYAADTKVSVARSQDEIRRTVERFGATSWAMGYDQERSFVGFVLAGRQLRFFVAAPDPADRKLTHTDAGKKRTRAQFDDAYAKAERSRWRALALVVKALLVAVDSGIWSIDEAFLAFVALPTGQTAGDWLLPQIDDAYQSGTMPSLLPGTRPALGDGGS